MLSLRRLPQQTSDIRNVLVVGPPHIISIALTPMESMKRIHLVSLLPLLPHKRRIVRRLIYPPMVHKENRLMGRRDQVQRCRRSNLKEASRFKEQAQYFREYPAVPPWDVHRICRASDKARFTIGECSKAFSQVHGYFLESFHANSDSHMWIAPPPVGSPSPPGFREIDGRIRGYVDRRSMQAKAEVIILCRVKNRQAPWRMVPKKFLVKLFQSRNIQQRVKRHP